MPGLEEKATTCSCVTVCTAGCTIEQLCEFLDQKFDVDVNILSVGNFCLYNSFLPIHKQQRYKKSIVKVRLPTHWLRLDIQRDMF